jgi:hypothetical protein
MSNCLQIHVYDNGEPVAPVQVWRLVGAVQQFHSVIRRACHFSPRPVIASPNGHRSA